MNSKQQAAAQTRAHLVEAALATLRQHGASNLTLDAVAKASGVSKGGLLHHFPNKEALMDALLRQLFTDFEQQVQACYEQEAAGNGRWLRAYIRATFEEDEALPLDLLLLLFASISEHPNLLRLVQDDHQMWQERLLSDGLPAARVRVIRMATDSYWQERLIGVEASDSDERGALLNELLHWLEAR